MIEDDFKEYLQSLNLKESSIELYLSIFRIIVEKYKELLENPNVVQSFLNKRNRYYNDTRLYYVVLKHFFNSKNIPVTFKCPLNDKRKRFGNYYSKDKILYFISCLRAPYALAAKVQFLAGARASEVLSLRKFDFQFVEDKVIINFQKAKRRSYSVELSGKIVEELQQYLSKFKFDEDYIFLIKTRSKNFNKRLKTNLRYYQLEFEKISKSLNIKLAPHDLKRNFARVLYEKTNDVLLVKQALHHEQIDTTLRYINYNSGKITELLKEIQQ